MVLQIDKVSKAINSKNRRKILSILCNQPMSASELYQSLGKDAPSYRQSVNKALEILKDAELVEKYYSEEKKAICYNVISKQIVISLLEMEVEGK